MSAAWHIENLPWREHCVWFIPDTVPETCPAKLWFLSCRRCCNLQQWELAAVAWAANWFVQCLQHKHFLSTRKSSSGGAVRLHFCTRSHPLLLVLLCASNICSTETAESRPPMWGTAAFDLNLLSVSQVKSNPNPLDNFSPTPVSLNEAKDETCWVSGY